MKKEALVTVALGLICALVLFIILLILFWKWHAIEAALKWRVFKKKKKLKKLKKDSRIIVHPKVPRQYFHVPTYPFEVQQPLREYRSTADPTRLFEFPNHFPRIYQNSISEVVSPSLSIVQETQPIYPSLTRETRTVSLCDINTDIVDFNRRLASCNKNGSSSSSSNGKTSSRSPTISPQAKRKLILQSKPEGEHVGDIEFSFGYDASKQRLQIHVKEAANLLSDEVPDCYVAVALLNDKKQIWQGKTKVVPMSIHPRFDETLEGTKLTPAKVRASVLRIHVFDVHSSKLIGEALLPVAEIEEENKSSLSSTLLPKKEETDDTEDEGDVFADTDARIGELMVILSHNPNEQKVSVGIWGARGLRLVKGAVKPDPFIKIEAHVCGRTIQTRSTNVVQKSQDPHWNETFKFDIPNDLLPKLTLIFKVKHKVKFGRGTSLGQVNIGTCVNVEAEYKHWVQVLDKPLMPIGAWHRIQVITY